MEHIQNENYAQSTDRQRLPFRTIAILPVGQLERSLLFTPRCARQILIGIALLNIFRGVLYGCDNYRKMGRLHTFCGIVRVKDLGLWFSLKAKRLPQRTGTPEEVLIHTKSKGRLSVYRSWLQPELLTTWNQLSRHWHRPRINSITK